MKKEDEISKHTLGEMLTDIRNAILNPSGPKEDAQPGLEKRPADYEYYGKSVMSNLDHEINRDIEMVIKNDKYFADYSGWNFHGTVWWDKTSQEWKCEVRCYHQHKETVSGKTLEDIMEIVSKKYGSD